MKQGDLARARRRLCPADRGGGRRHAGPVHRDPAAEGGPRPHRRPARPRRPAALRPACRSDRHRHPGRHLPRRSARLAARHRCAARRRRRARPIAAAGGDGGRALAAARPCSTRARRAAGGGTAYDDRVVRARLAQAFGRLIRRAGDRGMFVLLSAATPSRLLDAFPPGRRGAARCRSHEAIERVRLAAGNARPASCMLSRAERRPRRRLNEDPDAAAPRQIGLGRSRRSRFRPAAQPRAGAARRGRSGREMRALGLGCDRILASPARRASPRRSRSSPKATARSRRSMTSASISPRLDDPARAGPRHRRCASTACCSSATIPGMERLALLLSRGGGAARRGRAQISDRRARRDRLRRSTIGATSPKAAARSRASCGRGIWNKSLSPSGEGFRVRGCHQVWRRGAMTPPAAPRRSPPSPKGEGSISSMRRRRSGGFGPGYSASRASTWACSAGVSVPTRIV